MLGNAKFARLFREHGWSAGLSPRVTGVSEKLSSFHGPPRPHHHVPCPSLLQGSVMPSVLLSPTAAQVCRTHTALGSPQAPQAGRGLYHSLSHATEAAREDLAGEDS